MKRSSILIFAGAGLAASLCFISFANSRFSKNQMRPPDAVTQKNVANPSPRISGLRDITGESKIENVRAAINSGDPNEISLALDRLAQHAEEYPETFAGLLAALKLETEPQVLKALSQVVSEHWTDQREKLILATALEMSRSADPAKRRAAISLFSKASEATPALIDSLKRFQNDAEHEIRMAATATLNQWRSKFPESFEARKSGSGNS